jgi:hypothetical protein
MLLDVQTMDIGVPEPGGVSYGRTSAMYVRYKLGALPAGRAMLEEPLRVGERSSSRNLFALLEQIFATAELLNPSVMARSVSIRSFLRKCDQLVADEAKDRIEAAVAAMRIAPEDWWRATTR